MGISELWDEPEKILFVYSKEELQTKKFINIYSNINKEELKNMIYIKDSSILTIINKEKNEQEYYEKILEILDQYEKVNKDFQVEIVVEKRKNFDKYLEKIKNYKNIRIKTDLENYTLEEYEKEKNKLDKLVKNIKNSNMTPLEKYIGVYNIVKKIKPYKENENDKQQARKIKYILDGEYIVCQGYAELLIELLDRVDIESTQYSTTLREEKNKKIEYVGEHARVIVNMKDEKYGVDGYFIADPTWDNNKNKNDTINYALRPFESMQKTYYLFDIQPIDYILDNNSFGDFCKKINILLNKKIKVNKKNVSDFKKQLLLSYDYVFNLINNLLKDIDNKEYQNLKHYIETQEKTEKFYENYLTEIGKYIVSKSNKEINPNILAEAAKVANFNNEDIPDAFKEAYKDKILREYRNYTYEIPDNDIYNQDLEENTGGRHI